MQAARSFKKNVVFASLVTHLPLTLFIAVACWFCYSLTNEENPSLLLLTISFSLANLFLFAVGGVVLPMGSSAKSLAGKFLSPLVMALCVVALLAIFGGYYIGNDNWGAPLNWRLLRELLSDGRFFLQLAQQNPLKAVVLGAILIIAFCWYAFWRPTLRGDGKSKRHLLYLSAVAGLCLCGLSYTLQRNLSTRKELQKEVFVCFFSQSKPLQRIQNMRLGTRNWEMPSIDPTSFKAKNIIVISVDCLRSDHLSHRMYERKTTPFLDSLYEQGRITSFNVSTSTCSSSFCGILSTLNAVTYQNLTYLKFGIHDFLKKIGYQINFYLSGAHRSWYNLKQHYGKNIDRYVEGADVEGYSSYDDFFILDVLKDLPVNEKPQFFFIHLMGPHVLGTKHETFEKFKPTIGGSWIRRMRVNKYDPDSRNIYRNNYDNGIFQTDYAISQIHKILLEKGYLDDAILVIVGDHGESMGEYESPVGHGSSLRQNAIQVPIIFIDSQPGVYLEKDYATQVDIAPTIVDRLGLEVPEIWDGISLLNKNPSRITFHEQMGHGRKHPALAIVDKQPNHVFKYMYDQNSGEELYFDLKADPEEKQLLPISDKKRDYYTALLHEYMGKEILAPDTVSSLPFRPFKFSKEDSVYRFRLQKNAIDAVTKSRFVEYFGNLDNLNILQFSNQRKKQMRYDFVWIADNGDQRELSVRVNLSSPNKRLFRRWHRVGKYSKISGRLRPALYTTQDRSKYLMKVGTDLLLTIKTNETGKKFQSVLRRDFIRALHDELID